MKEFKENHKIELLNITAQLYDNHKQREALEKRVTELKSALATVEFLEKQEYDTGKNRTSENTG